MPSSNRWFFCVVMCIKLPFFCAANAVSCFCFFEGMIKSVSECSLKRLLIIKWNKSCKLDIMRLGKRERGCRRTKGEISRTKCYLTSMLLCCKRYMIHRVKSCKNFLMFQPYGNVTATMLQHCYGNIVAVTLPVAVAVAVMVSCDAVNEFRVKFSLLK